VANVVLATPTLAVAIRGQEGSCPYFVRPPIIRMEHHIEYIVKPRNDTKDWVLLRTLEEQHDKTWPDIDQRPPWKLIVVIEDLLPGDEVLVFDAVFAAHHAIADGRSTAEFHIKLLKELNGPPIPPRELSSGVLNTTGLPELPLPQEQVVPFTTSWGFLIRTLLRELGPAWLLGGQFGGFWTGDPVTREPCRTRLRLVTIPAASAPRILEACRRQHVTLTSLLHALVLASMARRLGSEQAEAFRSSTPIDLRPFIKDHQYRAKPGFLFGVYVTAQSHIHDANLVKSIRKDFSEAMVWKVATTLRNNIKQHVANIPKDDIMSMLGWVTDWNQFWLSKVGKPRHDTWEVSNIGSICPSYGEGDGSGQGGWRIQRSILSQGATVAGAAISVSVAGVAGCGIHLGLGWQEGIVEEGLVDGLTTDLQCWLDNLGRGVAHFLSCPSKEEADAF
jgi:hypothetical protein